MDQPSAKQKQGGKNPALRSLIWQIVLSLVLSIVFSAFPLVSALLLDKSSLPLAIFMSWYALFPPLVIFLVILLMNRKADSWLRTMGIIWINLSIWFLLQYLFTAIAGASMLLRLLALPAILAGNTGLFLAGGLVFLIGGLILYFAGRSTGKPAARPAVAYAAISVLIAIIIVAIPVFMIAASNPAGKSPKASALPSRDRIFSWISDVYNLGERRPGSEADHKAIQYLEAELRKSGLTDVRVETSKFDYWEPLKWELTLQRDNGQSWLAETFYVPYSGPTSKDGVTAEVVYLGDISSPKWQDVKDKIVLVDIPPADVGWDQMKIFTYMAYEPENMLKGISTPYPVGWMLKYIDFYKQAETRHPAAIIGILKGYPDMGKFTYYAPYDGELRPIPSLYVKQDAGDRIKELVAGGKLSAKVVLQANVAKMGGESANVYAVLPGRSDSKIMFQTHHDAPWRSGVEDSSGVGMVLALADYYAKVPAVERPYTMVFLFTGGHMVGGATNKDFIARHKADILSKTLFDIVIEHLADDYLPPNQATGNSQPHGVFLTENPVGISIFANTVVSNNISRTLLFSTGSPLGVPTDGSEYHEAGVPIVSLISGPAWLFDEADTLDRVDKQHLEPIAGMYIDFVSKVGATPEILLRLNLTWIVLGLLIIIFSPLAALFLAYKRK
jgi:heme/copper-type cytochrome/quinol oxidase subunit 4